MKKIYCDRCGKELYNKLKIFPIYEIKRINSNFVTDNINLCKNCEKDFKKWIEGMALDERYLITGVEDGWIRVDKTVWKEYIKVKGKIKNVRVKKTFNRRNSTRK